ncbi:MAG TPA: homogentisate 1,2-dioxygenase [Polyangiaceae bacterium]|jgi:homogentisate 1,2-dioxygenase|nr:homogentisate 1,2-dioxygenase [Polyangiaceae bacterium]
MLDRMACGELPAKHHTVLRAADGSLRYEECLTRAGFDGPYSILYHEQRLHESKPSAPRRSFGLPVAAPAVPLLRRHYRTPELASRGGEPLEVRVPLLFNDDVVIGVAAPSQDDSSYFVNGDADEIVFVLEGGGTLRSPFGDLRFGSRDYLCVPRGVLRRFLVDAGVPQRWLHIECRGGVGLPRQYRNELGQLSMGAPYSHRDFRRPEFRGPIEEQIRELSVLRNGAFHGYELVHSPLDVVGWDGSVYPWAFPIERFQARVGAVHLPPTVHGTFAARGALICSFVPRPLDFHPDALPCPYPHSSVDIDELLFYVAGNFTSRRGVDVGSISHHPAGIPHGPHPGAYEGSVGARTTDELAVMLDCARPLERTPAAVTIEDPAYHESFIAH